MNQNQETKAAGGDPVVEVTLRRKRGRFTAKERGRIVKESLRSDCKVAERLDTVERFWHSPESSRTDVESHKGQKPDT